MPRRSNFLLSLAFLFIAGACGGNGCAGCNLSPLPGGKLPADQTLEGGAQLRVTAGGFTKLTAIIPGVLNDALAGGMCIPRGGIGLGIGDINYCTANDGTCQSACKTNLHLDSVQVSVPADNQMRIRAQFDVQVNVPVSFSPIIGPTIGPCTLDVTANNNVVDAFVNFSINAQTGELELHVPTINQLNLNPSVSGCSFVGAVINAVAGVLADILNVGIVQDLLQPILENLIQGLLPSPLGLAATLDLSQTLPGLQPGATGRIEARVVPGGYVHLERNGMSLGVITGFNADEDPSTRTADLDSEPALCVPPFAAPDFAAAPASLTKSARGTFNLLPAGAFRGLPEPTGDLAIGISQSMLDLIGHHAVSSGSACLGIGTKQIPQLNLGTIGILVPSLAELGGAAGNDPLLLVTRPQQPFSFSIGDGTEASPSLTLHAHHFEIDFYAFLFERYVRGFTVSLDLDVGINLEFTTDAQGKPAILPVLVGLDSSKIGVTVLNEEFLREDKATLMTVLPSILDVALPLIGQNLGPIALPDFAGFSLTNLSTSKVTTSEDDFLAINATLGASAAMLQLAERYPSVMAVYDQLKAPEPIVADHGAPRLVKVIAPSPESMRQRLAGQGGEAPSVELEVPSHDALGRTLEWTWNLDGGLWRPFRPGGRLVLTDGAFYLQGRYDVQLAARVVGDYRTMDRAPSVVPVVIDSVAPVIHDDQASIDGDALVVPVTDVVSPADAIDVGFGAPGEARATDWGANRIATADAATLARDGQLEVFARDERGNLAHKTIQLGSLVPSHGDDAGGCDTGGTRGGGAGILALVAAALVFRPRRPRQWRRLGRIAAGLGLVLAAGLAPACSCGAAAADQCTMTEQCAAGCADGQIPLCLNGMCLCQDELGYGRIGQESEMALGGKGVWVSAYDSTYGDLMVTNVDHDGRIENPEWTFVDGVPDGPVHVDGSKVRGGIDAPGPNVGRYTDIAATKDGAMVSYFDQDGYGLKLATFAGGTWTSHTVDAGFKGADDTGYEIAGQYSSLTLDQAGRPGIAYFVQISKPGVGDTTELRFAQASTATPSAATDWTVTKVDSAVVPADLPKDPLTIPTGVGLFANAARKTDGTPVIAYYDRLNGQLKLATGGSGGFTLQVLDGGEGNDVGWYPGIVVDSSDAVHVTYVSAQNHELMYVSTSDLTPQLIDDGYRLVGQTVDGLPKPEFHFVGDDSAVVLTAAGPIVVYQDATTHELLMASLQGDGTWQHKTLVGDEMPFVGAYGFYASAAMDGGDLVISNWVIDQPQSDAWVEILRLKLIEG